MFPHPRWSRLLLAFLPCCFALRPALALDPAAVPGAREPDSAHWHCWYDAQRPAMACLLEDAPPELGEFPPGALTSKEIYLALRKDPGRLADEPVYVPLYAPPIDMNRAHQLARNVVCFRQPHCSIDFAPPSGMR